jgi:hypothetical protein
LLCRWQQQQQQQMRRRRSKPQLAAYYPVNVNESSSFGVANVYRPEHFTELSATV